MSIPRPYHHGDLRRALLDAALEIVDAHGAAALSMRAIARKANVSHMAPYHHFADKATLIAAVAEEGFRALERGMRERIGASSAGPRAQFRESGVAYVVFAVRHPNLFRVMFSAELADTSGHPSLAEAASAAFAVVQGLVQQSQEVESVSAADARQIGLTAWSLVHGLAMLCIDGQFGPEATEPAGAQRLAYEATGTLFRVLRPSNPER